MKFIKKCYKAKLIIKLPETTAARPLTVLLAKTEIAYYSPEYFKFKNFYLQ